MWKKGGGVKREPKRFQAKVKVCLGRQQPWKKSRLKREYVIMFALCLSSLCLTLVDPQQSVPSPLSHTASLLLSTLILKILSLLLRLLPSPFANNTFQLCYTQTLNPDPTTTFSYPFHHPPPLLRRCFSRSLNSFFLRSFICTKRYSWPSQTLLFYYCPKFVPRMLNNNKKTLSLFHFKFMSLKRSSPIVYVLFTYFFIYWNRSRQYLTLFKYSRGRSYAIKKNFTPRKNPDKTQFISHSRKAT